MRKVVMPNENTQEPEMLKVKPGEKLFPKAIRPELIVLACTIRKCETIRSNTSGFCFECKVFPCARLRRLDLRYRTKYHMSMLENLVSIDQEG